MSDDFTVTGDELDRCLDRAERAEAEVVRLRAALDTIRLHAEGQVSQYARARESVLSVALEALRTGGLSLRRETGERP